MSRRAAGDADTEAARALVDALAARDIGPRWYECRAAAEALFKHVNAGSRAGLDPFKIIMATLLQVRDAERRAVEADVRREAAAALAGGIDAARREMVRELDNASARARRIMGVEP